VGAPNVQAPRHFSVRLTLLDCALAKGRSVCPSVCPSVCQLAGKEATMKNSNMRQTTQPWQKFALCECFLVLPEETAE